MVSVRYDTRGNVRQVPVRRLLRRDGEARAGRESFGDRVVRVARDRPTTGRAEPDPRLGGAVKVAATGGNQLEPIGQPREAMDLLVGVAAVQGLEPLHPLLGQLADHRLE